MVTFAVDPVEPVRTLLPRAAYDLEKTLGARVLARSPGLEACVAPPNLAPFSGVNGFALAVHLAFSQHRPLVLSPDAVWLTILQGFAIHVRENEAELRARFVQHQGKKTVSVTRVSLDGGWPEIVDGFILALSDEVNPGLIQAMTDRFSTTGETEHTAHCIASMDAFARFFDYELLGVCGIPSITLLGTPEDWRTVRERFRVLTEYGMQWWQKRLDPVLERFVRAAEGDSTPSFWQCIYKPEKAYAGDHATGWVVRFFPYLERDVGTYERHEMKSLKGKWVHQAVKPSSFPKGLSKATLRTQEPGAEPRLQTLCAGFFGVRQETDGALMPHVGWAVLEEENAQLWEALSRAHQLPPPRADRQLEGPSVVPALLLEFYDRFDGGPLYGGELVLSSAPFGMSHPMEWRKWPFHVPLRGSAEGQSADTYGAGSILSDFALRLGTLRDGSDLLWLREGHRRADSREYVLLRRADVAPPYTVVANSLLELYQRLASGSSFPPWEVKGEWSPP